MAFRRLEPAPPLAKASRYAAADEEEEDDDGTKITMTGDDQLVSPDSSSGVRCLKQGVVKTNPAVDDNGRPQPREEKTPHDDEAHKAREKDPLDMEIEEVEEDVCSRPKKAMRTAATAAVASSQSRGGFAGNEHPNAATEQTKGTPSPVHLHATQHSHPSHYDSTERSSVEKPSGLRCAKKRHRRHLNTQKNFATSFTSLTGAPSVKLSTLLDMLDHHRDDFEKFLVWMSGWMSQNVASPPRLIVDRNVWGEIPLHYWIRCEWHNPLLRRVLEILLERYPDLVYCECSRGNTVLDTMAAVWTALTGFPKQAHNRKEASGESSDDSTGSDESTDRRSDTSEKVDLVPVSHAEEGSLRWDLSRALLEPLRAATVSTQLRALFDLYQLLLQAARKTVRDSAVRPSHAEASTTAGDRQEAWQRRQRVLSLCLSDKNQVPLSFLLLSERLEHH